MFTITKDNPNLDFWATGPEEKEDNMKEIKGQSGSVKFDVTSTDGNTKLILDAVVSNMLKSIVDKDRNDLEEMLKIKVTVGSKSYSNQYARENLENPLILPLGGLWAYSVAMTADASGGKSVQICKGKIIGDAHRDKETQELTLTPYDPLNPITKANKLNIKSLEEWINLQQPVTKRLNVLNV